MKKNNSVSHINTVTFMGVQVALVDVEVQMSSGIPAFHIVGLPDKTIAESRERIRSALYAIGISLPPKRFVINLSPADIQKEGNHYDLPIIMGVMAQIGAINNHDLMGIIAMGELSLNGDIRSVQGILPAALEASALKYKFVCPLQCGAEAALATDLEILAPKNLTSLVNHFRGHQILTPPIPSVVNEDKNKHSQSDMADIKGQRLAKRALEIAAAGRHNLLMSGPPGVGKSLIASQLPDIMPKMTAKEALDVTMIHSIAGVLQDGALLTKRPFRDPHHSSSLPAIVGGGMKARPGEISLAHNGVLFLDELPEFSKQTLEALRQPLENRKITVSRANANYSYMADIQLIAAMNPCVCGYFGTGDRECSKAPKCAEDYQKKISGPIFDRIDLYVDVDSLTVDEITSLKKDESTATVKNRVDNAWEIQQIRYQGVKNDKNSSIMSNAHADGEILQKTSKISEDALKLLRIATERLSLSARSYTRVIRVARTIADLSASETIETKHMGEALSFRRILPTNKWKLTG